MPKTVKRSTPQTTRITLRLPKELHAALANLAVKEERSLNNQIVHLLKQATGKP